MKSRMLPHIALLREGLPSLPAFIRLNPLMHPGMVDHIPRPLHNLIAVLVLAPVYRVPVARRLVLPHDNLILKILQYTQTRLYFLPYHQPVTHVPLLLSLPLPLLSKCYRKET